ncbi:DUF6794 domain-containing protein [Pedobacter suwonensis]|uniref:DUF6794 domain-containing protein n=1 Tax=Pedobacter suwonensis TaxID=332999 RepID=UPI0011A030CC|nr:DUF6794 domain-containing protein [Pedobacter suwonensis]
MKTLVNFLLLISCFGCSSVSSPKTQAMPKNLEESISYLKNEWTSSELNSFKTKSEKQAVAEAHLGAGLWIRNNWIRGDRNVPLAKYFRSLGINHPDGISSIILTSLHRKLNNKKIDVDHQIEEYKIYWKPISECEEKAAFMAVKNYNRFNEGDHILIYMHVDNTDGSRNAVILDCPNVSWKFDPKTDLLIKGTVVKKYNINAPSNVFFTVKINSANRSDTDILMQKIKIGEDIDFSLIGLNIE